MKPKYYLTLAIVIIIALGIIYSGYESVLNQDTSTATVVRTDTKIANFEAETIDKETYVFKSDAKVRVFEVFAEWCLPCRKSVPEAIEFANQNNSVEVIGVAFRDVPFKVREFEKEYGKFETTILANGKVEKALGISSAPQTLFVKDDRIVYRAYGLTSSEELKNILLLIK
jgi:thiol-disulfide isomerase/thioredoxin